MLDKKRLRDKMTENCYSMDKLSSILGINPATLYRKMMGSSDFTRNEIQLLRGVLALTNEDTELIFFAPELANTQV